MGDDKFNEVLLSSYPREVLDSSKRFEKLEIEELKIKPIKYSDIFEKQNKTLNDTIKEFANEMIKQEDKAFANWLEANKQDYDLRFIGIEHDYVRDINLDGKNDFIIGKSETWITYHGERVERIL